MNRKIYRQVAKKHGVSVAQVKREMQKAIDSAYENPTAEAKSVNCKGNTPTADELINHVVQKIRND